jgi:hypothetical protein
VARCGIKRLGSRGGYLSCIHILKQRPLIQLEPKPFVPFALFRHLILQRTSYQRSKIEVEGSVVRLISVGCILIKADIAGTWVQIQETLSGDHTGSQQDHGMDSKG